MAVRRRSNPAAEQADLLRHEGRALSGHAERREIPTGFFGEDAGGSDGGMLTLGRAHADGGIALQQFDIVIAVGGAVLQVFHLQVLVEIDEVPALRVIKIGRMSDADCP
jgi:hypothetical protein